MRSSSKPTAFNEFVVLCESLKATSSKLEKADLVANFLQQLQENEIEAACLFILGKAFADNDVRVLNVSWQTLRSVTEAAKDSETGPDSLAIPDVSRTFEQISETAGKGSRNKIKALLHDLYQKATSKGREWLSRIIFGEMRIGVAEGVLLDGISKAADVPLDLVRRANMYLGHPGAVASIALEEGVNGLKNVRLQMFRPVQPMLAALAEDFETVFKEHGGTTSLEFKFDGARAQIHKQGKQVRVYSRHLTDVTASLPDLVQTVQANLKAENAIVEGEVVAVGQDGRPLPFQELMRRFRRVHKIETLVREVPTRLYLFDLLSLEGRALIDASYKERMAFLADICRPDILVNRLETGEIEAAQAFLNDALVRGHEGLMAKSLDSEYTPSSRGKRWFKIKPSETLDLVIVAADWGSGRRVGWLSNYHLAALDSGSGDFLELGKTFKGLTDAQFKWMTDKLSGLKLRETRYTVYVKPEVVVEVAYNEIQRSPNYKSGLALRFARIKRIREDKDSKQADTIERVRSLYEQQFKRKARSGEEAKFK